MRSLLRREALLTQSKTFQWGYITRFPVFGANHLTHLDLQSEPSRCWGMLALRALFWIYIYIFHVAGPDNTGARRVLRSQDAVCDLDTLQHLQDPLVISYVSSKFSETLMHTKYANSMILSLQISVCNMG